MHAPPANLITNQGLTTLQGLAGGVAAGGFRVPVNVVGNDRGVIFVPYGSMGSRKNPAGAMWEGRFRMIAVSLGVSVEEAKQIWRTQGLQIGNWKPSRLVAYTGDPLVSIPPDDMSLADLQSENWGAISAYLGANEGVIPIFWENTGQRTLGTLDLLLGDFELNTGYSDVRHHYPFLAVVGGVGPADFGINPASANMVQLNGDMLACDPMLPYVGQIGIAGYDPVMVPEPGAFGLMLGCLLTLICSRLACIGRKRI